MSKRSGYTCENCGNTRQITFCRDCAQLVCGSCVYTKKTPNFFCKTCKESTNQEQCGHCGNECQISTALHEEACPTCHSVDLGDPDALLNNLPTEFFSIISNVQDVLTEIADLYRSFDFMVALVRFCRIAGFLGFPQIEFQLTKCGRGLQLINEKAVSQLTKIRQEALHDLWNVHYFEDVEIEHFRSADAILKNTEDKITHLNMIVRKWIAEVQEEVDKLTILAHPLRQHYSLLAKIKRYLPEGIHFAAAIIPPIGMNVTLKPKKFKGEAYSIFSEEYLVFLPQKALENKDDIVNGIKVLYKDITDFQTSHSVLHGSQLKVGVKQGQIAISAPTPVLDRITQYFDLVKSDQSFMVGSPKDIKEIEFKAPDKNDFKRATTKFIQIFRERLFGDPVQQSDNSPTPMPSIKELLSRVRQLEETSKNIDFQAKNHQINIPEYQDNRNDIRREYASIQQTLQQLGGHLTKNMKF